MRPRLSSHLALTALDPLRLRPASSEFSDGASLAIPLVRCLRSALICSGVRTARGARARGLKWRSLTTGGHKMQRAKFRADQLKTMAVHKEQRNTFRYVCRIRCDTVNDCK